MSPTRWPPPPLFLLLFAAAAATATTNPSPSAAPPPSPTPWPERFHAVMFTNLTNYSVASTGPPLRITDLYYDWPRRRNLNLVRHQLSADPLYDVEWDNGTSFYFDSSTCRTERFPVGVLPPWWLSGGGAEYLGREVTGGIECHVWGKAGFIVYYEEASTGRPVRWNFIDVHWHRICSDGDPAVRDDVRARRWAGGRTVAGAGALLPGRRRPRERQ
ncbi:unnamed protein product [Urochloa humidicola]